MKNVLRRVGSATAANGAARDDLTTEDDIDNACTPPPRITPGIGAGGKVGDRFAAELPPDRMAAAVTELEQIAAGGTPPDGHDREIAVFLTLLGGTRQLTPRPSRGSCTRP